MDTTKALEATVPAGTAATEPVLLEPEAMIEQLRALSRQIPQFEHLPSSTRRLMRATTSAHPEFVRAALAAVGASPAVQDAVGGSPEQLLEDAHLADRWSAVEAEARSLLVGIASANLARRHRVGLAALRAYSISRQLVRGDENSDLLTHVAEMKRTNRFGRVRRKPDADSKPAPIPQSPQ